MIQINCMTDEDLLAFVRTRLDLVTTDLERDLAARFADALDEIERLEEEISDNDE